jgi:hypothetical protein
MRLTPTLSATVCSVIRGTVIDLLPGRSAAHVVMDELYRKTGLTGKAFRSTVAV